MKTTRIIIDDAKRVSLDAPYFDRMRLDLDCALRSAIAAMQQKKISSSAISLKIDVSVFDASVKDNNAPGGTRNALIPNISYKVATVMQAKSEHKGDVIQGEHELIQDDSGAYFIVDKDEASGQLNMFNGYDELDDEQEDEE